MALTPITPQMLKDAGRVASLPLNTDDLLLVWQDGAMVVTDVSNAAGNPDVVVAVNANNALNSIMIVEDFQHSSLDKLTLTAFSLLDSNDAQIASIDGSEDWKGGRMLRYQSGSSVSNNLQAFGAASFAGSQPYTMLKGDGDKFQMQSIFALPLLSATGNEYSFAVGFAHVSVSNPQSPITAAGYASAYLYTNTVTGNWHAYSNVAASSQDTDTGIAVLALTSTKAEVIIGTTGIVEFYLDGVLVATHSAAGVIVSGSQLNPFLTWFNIATQTLAPDNRNIYIDLFAYKLDFANRGLSWR